MVPLFLGDAVGGVAACGALAGPFCDRDSEPTNHESGRSALIPAALSVTVIMPTLDAAHHLARSLESAKRPGAVVAADGGSSDDTNFVATINGAQVVATERERGAQLAAGARVAMTD